jgi:hypothetical protein
MRSGVSAAAERALDAMAVEPMRLEAALRALGIPALRRLSRLGLGTVLRSARLRSAIGHELGRQLLQVRACCQQDGCHHRFLRQYLDLGSSPSARAFVTAYLARQGRRRTAQLLDAYLRMALCGVVRHELLQRRRARHAEPAAVLVEAQLAPYPDCNQSCVGCYSEGERQGTAPDRKRLAALVDEAAACGAWAIHVVGKGEPFLSPERGLELCAVVAARPHLLFTIATNGTCFSPELGRALAKLGNVLLLVSIDGPKAVHDARRGPGSFEAVSRALELMRAHRLLFGFSCMVSATNHRQVTEPAFVGAMARAGCAIGVFSRYFPLSPSHWQELLLTGESLASYRAAFERLRRQPELPLLDFDEVEAHTGCLARAGISVYLDGLTGQVAPCIRAPFAPPECRIDPERPGGLGRALGHPFFVGYRAGALGPEECCARDHGQSLGRLADELARHGVSSARLAAYRARTLEASAAGAGRVDRPPLGC